MKRNLPSIHAQKNVQGAAHSSSLTGTIWVHWTSWKYFSKFMLCFWLPETAAGYSVWWDCYVLCGHVCFLSFSTHRWVKFGMNWSRSWAAFLWDLAVCQLHHCHLQRETSSPINVPSIPHGARRAVGEGVGPLPPMNPPNSYFYFF